MPYFLSSPKLKIEKNQMSKGDCDGFVCVCTCLLFVVDCFNKKSVVAIISFKRKIGQLKMAFDFLCVSLYEKSLLSTIFSTFFAKLLIAFCKLMILFTKIFTNFE
jgi:hypothetical protein